MVQTVIDALKIDRQSLFFDSPHAIVLYSSPPPR